MHISWEFLRCITLASLATGSFTRVSYASNHNPSDPYVSDVGRIAALFGSLDIASHKCFARVPIFNSSDWSDWHKFRRSFVSPTNNDPHTTTLYVITSRLVWNRGRHVRMFSPSPCGFSLGTHTPKTCILGLGLNGDCKLIIGMNVSVVVCLCMKAL